MENYEYVSASQAKTQLVETAKDFIKAWKNYYRVTLNGEAKFNEKLQVEREREAKIAQDFRNRNHLLAQKPGKHIFCNYNYINTGSDNLQKKIVESDKSPVETILDLFRKHKKAEHINLFLTDELTDNIFGHRREGNAVALFSRSMDYRNILSLDTK